MKEMFVPFALVIMLISMIIPIPNALLDLFLVTNLVVALVLLLSTLIVTDPLKLSSLPSMLLLATMFRLSLNVSTTRMILSSGNAGAIIDAFGGFVIKGNVIVGLIVFCIITLIQFIVIAKGSERIAEVSARFTLDALPGKQMSIDADVRAGLIDFNEARIKRQNLQTESRFYGALDGAMKFIKGDAIAGIVITAINIIGGFAIGILIDHYDFTQAFRHYTMLSVGDGLVSQIPALLNSLAAGMIITRVINDEESSLSIDVLTQLSQNQKVLSITSILSFFIAFVPNIPILPFITLSFVLLGIVIYDTSTNNKRKSKEKKLIRNFIPKTPPLLQVNVSQKVLSFLAALDFDTQLATFQQVVFEKYGLFLKQPDFILHENTGYQIFLRGNVCKTYLNEDSAEDISTQLLKDLLYIVAEYKIELIDDVMTRRLVDNIESVYPELVSNVIPNILTITQITAIIRSLVKDGISIKNFDVILQALAEYGSKAGGERYLLEEVRIALKRVITQTFSHDGILKIYVLDPMLDIACAKAERGSNQIPSTSISQLIEEVKAIPSNTVLVASRSARAFISDFFELRNVSIPVLAHEELLSNSNIEMLGYLGSNENSKEFMAA